MNIKHFATSVFVAILVAAAGARAQSPEASPDSRTQYVGAHERIDLGGGRKINLFCLGSGDTTVLFDSGLSDWSSIWALVQPRVADRARACSYDRAGMGYSDPATSPRSPIAIVGDMHTLVEKAKLKGPLLLVGHSLGGFNMKLYAALFPADVGGLVLVDPSEERMFDRTRAMLQKRFDPPSFQWTPMLAFRSWRGVSDEREA
ncbi:alpha/beta fold hydrolase, partial [Caulobacter segnis]